MKGLPQSTIGAYVRQKALGAYTRQKALGALGFDDFSEYFGATSQSVEMYDYPAASLPAASGGSWLDTLKSIGSDVGSIIGQVTAADSQKKIVELNMERARRGLPPISSSSLAPQMNFGMAPDTRDTVVMIALGLGGAYLVSQAMKRRGSR